MNKGKIISGAIGAILGFIIFVFAVNLIAKPDNYPLVFDPMASIETYFFSFSYSAGLIGSIIGAILLMGYLILFYFLGMQGYKMFRK